MKSDLRYLLIFLLAIGLFLSSCLNKESESNCKIFSPSGDIMISFYTNDSGEAVYLVNFKEKPVIAPSTLGFTFKNMGPIGADLNIKKISYSSSDTEWEQPWGEQRLIIDRYEEMHIDLKENRKAGREFSLTFRAYDDGIAFRYNFTKHAGFEKAIILEENTEFSLTDNLESWWIPADWDSYEHLYNHTIISDIDALSKFDPGINQCSIKENAVSTPFTMRSNKGYYLSIHEANLTDYASMTLLVDTINWKLKSALVDSDREGYAVMRNTPFQTPWRMIQITETPGALIESKMILNLNEPNKLSDVSWIKPTKYNGIWWEMHLGISTWDMESGHHGATTANAKKYIDFAATHKLGGVLIEGWNTGWDRWTGIPDREGVFDFVTSYPDYDLEEVVRYAKENGLELIMHHETSAAPRTYEQQLDTAYSLMQKLDLHYAKLGYVGKIIPDGEYHHGQWMVNHYRKVLETAAKYNIAIDIHEPIKPTGLRRTYPNLISAEGLRGQEFNAWARDGGNPPEHLTIVPFTRMLAGPIDYTPGIFDLMLNPFRPNNRVNTSLAQQLALYVIIYSPVQMAADLPENYGNNPAFKFIEDVAVDWEKTLVLDGEIGDYITIARLERNGNRWFLGTITDEQPREKNIALNFLDKNIIYIATIYKDSKTTDWKSNPEDIKIETMEVNNEFVLNLNLAAGGGAAISFVPKIDLKNN